MFFKKNKIIVFFNFLVLNFFCVQKKEEDPIRIKLDSTDDANFQAEFKIENNREIHYNYNKNSYLISFDSVIEILKFIFKEDNKKYFLLVGYIFSYLYIFKNIKNKADKIYENDIYRNLYFLKKEDIYEYRTTKINKKSNIFLKELNNNENLLIKMQSLNFEINNFIKKRFFYSLFSIIPFFSESINDVIKNCLEISKKINIIIDEK